MAMPTASMQMMVTRTRTMILRWRLTTTTTTIPKKPTKKECTNPQTEKSN